MSLQDKPTPDETGNRRFKGFVTVEIIGELILLCMVAGFFIYIGVSARNWPFSAKLTPLIAVAIGTPFLIWRFITVIRLVLAIQVRPVSLGQIMDTGFRTGGDSKTEGQRFLKVFVALAVLYGGIYLLGFHITVPIWVFVYMRWFGKVPLIWAAATALMFVVLIFGLYDQVLDALWHEPALWKWLS